MKQDIKNLIIRKYDNRDSRQIILITLLAWVPIYASFKKLLGRELYKNIYPNWKKRKTNQIKHWLKNKTTVTYVAELNMQVVGFVCCVADKTGPLAEIEMTAVHPDFQGMGISTKLFKTLFKQMKSTGKKYIKVKTGGDPAHAPARKAYEKVGFDRAIPKVDYYCKL
jgi:ribosomal protein S18 acetylase RimI-like enzyme